MTAKNITHALIPEMTVQLQLLFTTVVRLLNQGTLRIRAVIECGVLFGYFLASVYIPTEASGQKVTKKNWRLRQPNFIQHKTYNQ